MSIPNSAIEARAAESGGGRIELGSGEIALLERGRITSRVQGGAGNSGSIAARPDILVLRDSQLEADARGGDAGRVTIGSDFLIADPTTAISAASQFGRDGTVDVQSPELALLGGLAELPVQFAAPRLAPHCAARTPEAAGQFVLDTRARSGSALDLEWLPISDASATEPLAVVAAGGENTAEWQAQRALREGDYARAERSLQAALATEAGDDPARSAALLARLGEIYAAAGENALAQDQLRRGAEPARAAKRPAQAARLLLVLGNRAAEAAQQAVAGEAYAEAAALARGGGFAELEAQAEANAARATLYGGNLERTAGRLERALTLTRALPASKTALDARVHTAQTLARLAERGGHAPSGAAAARARRADGRGRAGRRARQRPQSLAGARCAALPARCRPATAGCAARHGARAARSTAG